MNSRKREVLKETTTILDMKLSSIVFVQVYDCFGPILAPHCNDCYLLCDAHSILNRKFCCFSFIIAVVHQNSPTMEFLQEKIEGNLRRANTEPSVDFRRANTEPSVDFRKANTEPSVDFRRANTETYWKQSVNLSNRVGKDRVFLELAGLLLGISLRLCPWEIPRSSPASPWKTPAFPPLLLKFTQSHKRDLSPEYYLLQ